MPYASRTSSLGGSLDRGGKHGLLQRLLEGLSTASHGWLSGLLLLTIVVPALAFAWGRDDGRIAFVLYREPKAIAIATLGWILVTVFAWIHRAELPARALREILQRPAILVLTALMGYLALTGLWVRVPQNYFYELNQYLLLFALLLTLLVRRRSDGTIPAQVRYGLVASLALVTAAGALQAAVPLPFLSPINPEIGALHPSFMGYKNPAALAVLGQLFLLAQLVFDGGLKKTHRRGWGLLLLAELLYLVSLGSRTAYAALLAASMFLIVLSLLRHPSRRRTLRTLGGAAGVVVLLATFTALHGPTRDRAGSLAFLLSHPRAYLETDRGTYLVNTLNMVRHHPYGVGLGDWQTHYPVFRRHGRTVAFNDRFQVRRAHSDHVQLLGEAGWPGFVLWLTFLFLLVFGTARHYLRTGHPASLFGASQLVAFATAMATDYLLEIPYNKFQFFLVVFLALARPDETRDTPSGKPDEPTANASFPTLSFPGTLLAVGLTLFTLTQLFYQASLARKVYTAAQMEQAYWGAGGRTPDAPRMTELGLDFADLVGHTKSFHKHYLLLAHSAHLVGQRDLALAAARKSLALHPYHPNTFQLLSIIVEDPQSARRWRAAYDHVMDEATHGFEGIYPDLPP